jgi:hypothetical protein
LTRRPAKYDLDLFPISELDLIFTSLHPWTPKIYNGAALTNSSYAWAD